MIYVLMNCGDIYSVHTSLDEANQYLLELNKILPDDWEIQSYNPGRRAGEDELIWGYEAVVDLLDGSIHQVMKTWLWKSWCVEPKFSEKCPRYMPFKVDAATESEARSQIKKWLGSRRYLVEGDYVSLII
jgi:hypothetical protein